MNAMLALNEDHDLAYSIPERTREPGRSTRRESSASRARFGRRSSGGAKSFNGAHRRRNKRNYL